MRIAISLLNFRPGAVGGVETYLRKLIAHLPAHAGGDDIRLVVGRDVAEEIVVPGVEREIVPASGRRTVRARIVEALTPCRARAFERIFERLSPDVALFPQQSIFPKRVGGPCVLTVCDIQHLVVPRQIALVHRAFRKRIYPFSLRRADRIIAISEHTRRSLIERCGVEPGKVVAIPFGRDPVRPDDIAPYDGVGGPYLYYPAATFPHKGHETLMRTFAALRKGGDFDGKLVLTGMQTPHWRRLRRLMGRLDLIEHVVHLGFVPYETVRRLYAGAEAVVFPTTYEGFGLPTLEAAELGRKLIVSRLPIFDEVGVPPQWQIDFADPDALAAALRRDGPTELGGPIRTWSDVARETLDVLRSVAAAGS